MIQSMTAFARLSSQDSSSTATWEIRVVNHRYFDSVIKLPELFKPLEAEIRMKLQQQLHRGRIDCMLRFNSDNQNSSSFELNTPLVKKLIVLVSEVKTYLPMANVDPMKILSWPGMLQTKEVDLAAVPEMVMNLFTKTLAELVATRKREGLGIANLIQEQLQLILALVTKIKDKIPQIVANHRLKVTRRLEEITSSLDQSRLEQELVYLAQKIDVTEEIDRLVIHVNEVLRVLENGGVAGKRLDFLMQELNREANTLAAKSIDGEITQTSIELKVLIEQMREQVQNLV